MNVLKNIILAGGCFWGVEAYFSKIKGVNITKVGYVNGNTENPTYQDVCYSNTGFAEGCYLEYDEKELSLKALLDAFWLIIDPTVKDRQGHDIGNQYRTGIYFFDNSDKPIIEESKAERQEHYKTPIVTEILPVKNFYEAEDYHQKYLEKNPNGYCHIPKELLKG